MGGRKEVTDDAGARARGAFKFECAPVIIKTLATIIKYARGSRHLQPPTVNGRQGSRMLGLANRAVVGGYSTSTYWCYGNADLRHEWEKGSRHMCEGNLVKCVWFREKSVVCL